jgi:hypothetical protein
MCAGVGYSGAGGGGLQGGAPRAAQCAGIGLAGLWLVVDVFGLLYF